MSKRGYRASATKKKQPKAKKEQYVPIDPTPSWQLLAPSFKLFRDNALLVAPVVLLPSFLLQMGAALINGSTRNDNWLKFGIGLEIFAVITLIASASASYVVQLQAAHGEKTNLYQVYKQGFYYWPRVAGFSILFAILLIGGGLLFVVPGLIILRRYVLAPYFLVDRNLGIRRAMQQSAAASYPVRWHIWTMLAIILGTAGLGLAAGKISPIYGGFFTSLIPIVTTFIPILRYEEAGYNYDLERAAEE